MTMDPGENAEKGNGSDSSDDSEGIELEDVDVLSVDANSVGASTEQSDSDDADEVPRGAIPSDEPVLELDAVVVMPGRMGLMDHGLAPTSRATCFICKLPIITGSWRFQYRTKNSNTFAVVRWLHQGCCDRLPAVSRANDIRLLTSWMLKTTVDEANASLKAAVETLQSLG
jgi:hypothetical protein